MTRVRNIVYATMTPKTPKKNTSIKYLIVIISTNLTLKMNAFNYPYTIKKTTIGIVNLNPKRIGQHTKTILMQATELYVSMNKVS